MFVIFFRVSSSVFPTKAFRPEHLVANEVQKERKLHLFTRDSTRRQILQANLTSVDFNLH